MAGDALGNGFADASSESRLIALFGLDHLDQVWWARQAAGVGGKDAVNAAFHGGSSSKRADGHTGRQVSRQTGR
jgi:hypothetical protein